MNKGAAVFASQIFNQPPAGEEPAPELRINLEVDARIYGPSVPLGLPVAQRIAYPFYKTETSAAVQDLVKAQKVYYNDQGFAVQFFVTAGSVGVGAVRFVSPIFSPAKPEQKAEWVCPACGSTAGRPRTCSGCGKVGCSYVHCVDTEEISYYHNDRYYS